MRLIAKTLLSAACVSLFVCLMTNSASAQKAKKYRSPFTPDETFDNIEFQYTRVRDPGATGEDYFQYGYKNNSDKKLRISFSISGAGMTSPHTGSVVVGGNETKGGGGRGMFLNGSRGGHLTSRITGLAEVGKRQNSIYSDFESLDKTLSPKKKREQVTAEISRILQDNRKRVAAKAKQQLSGIAGSANNKSRKNSHGAERPEARSKIQPPVFKNQIEESEFGVMILYHQIHSYDKKAGVSAHFKPGIWYDVKYELSAPLEDSGTLSVGGENNVIQRIHSESILSLLSIGDAPPAKAPDGNRTMSFLLKLYDKSGKLVASGEASFSKNSSRGDGGFRTPRIWEYLLKVKRNGSALNIQQAAR